MRLVNFYLFLVFVTAFKFNLTSGSNHSKHLDIKIKYKISNLEQNKLSEENLEAVVLSTLINMSKMKYILAWKGLKKSADWPKQNLGQTLFLNRNCSESNCYVVTNKKYFKYLTDFDAILFDGKEIMYQHLQLPKKRSPLQKYVYFTRESSDNNPVCSDKFNSFFNLTWTYKVNSDVYFGYIIIRNKQGEVIGPKTEMHWMKPEDMTPIDEKLKEKLKTKKIAAAWIVSDCKNYHNLEFASQIQKELVKFELTLDIYGKCGNKSCPDGDMTACLKKIEEDYFFCFAFENSLSNDYVTEQLLSALKHYAVPVVYGAANYTRFMPDGIYLNALMLGPQKLAKQMADAINNKEMYYDFFKWHNHYTYHAPEESPETDEYCQLCKKIHDEKNATQTYENFREWWTSVAYEPVRCKLWSVVQQYVERYSSFKQKIG